MPDEDDSEEHEVLDDEEAGPPRDWLTRKELADFLGVHESTVIRHERAGDIASMTPTGKRAKFRREDAMRLRQQRRAEKSNMSAEMMPAGALAMTEDTGGGGDARIKADVARQHIGAQAITDMTAGAISNAAEFGRQLILAVKNFSEGDRKHFELILQHYQKEVTRLQGEVEAMRTERTEFLETLEEMRRETAKERDRLENRAFLREQLLEGKGLAKAWIATKMKDPAAKDAMATGGFADFMRTLTPDQANILVNTLRPEQIVMLQALQASQQTPAEKQETGE